MPLEDTEIDARKFGASGEEKVEFGGYGGATGKVEVIQQINHQGEVGLLSFARVVLTLFVFRLIGESRALHAAERQHHCHQDFA